MNDKRDSDFQVKATQGLQDAWFNNDITMKIQAHFICVDLQSRYSEMGDCAYARRLLLLIWAYQSPWKHHVNSCRYFVFLAIISFFSFYFIWTVC